MKKSTSAKIFKLSKQTKTVCEPAVSGRCVKMAEICSDCRTFNISLFIICSFFLYFCVTFSFNMRKQPLTKELLDQILGAKLDNKLSPLKIKIDDMSRTMIELR